MAILTVKQIHQAAHQLIKQQPGGIRFTQLRDQIKQANPQTPLTTIQAALVTFNAQLPSDVTKPSRGLFALIVSDGTTTANGNTSATGSSSSGTPSVISEDKFYQPFADYLVTELGEVVAAEGLGNSVFATKWGTPDVVGVYKPQAGDRIGFPVEIVTAEIKTATTASVTAFGQAAAYRLFSSKVYVVMPATLSDSDRSRLEALCMLFGIGFVIFDATNAASPNFQTIIRAQRYTPDMFYVNEFANRLHQHNTKLYNKLF